MKYLGFIVIFIFTTFVGHSHSAAISDLQLVQGEKNLWTLQVRSSIDAFRTEVKTHFSEDPYQSPEEFKSQVIEHLNNTIKILVNDKEAIKLGEANVQLGHETTVFYNNIKLPENVSSIKIIGTMFKDIYRSKVRLIFLKDDINKQALSLSKENKFTAHLSIENHKLQANANSKAGMSFGFIFLVFIVTALFLIYKLIDLLKKKLAILD